MAFNIRIPFVMASHGLKRAGTAPVSKAKASPFGFNTSNSNKFWWKEATTLRYGVSEDATQTLTNKTLTSPVINGASGTGNVILYSADGAISLASQLAVITKAGSACLLSVAAPGASGVGLRITVISNSAFAHVITFTGATLWDGTTGANTTVTMTAFPGSAITVVGLSATIWGVESQNVLTSIA